MSLFDDNNDGKRRCKWLIDDVYIYINVRLPLFLLFLFLVLIHEVEFLIECARFPPLPIYDNGKNNNSKLRMDTHLLVRRKKTQIISINKKKSRKWLLIINIKPARYSLLKIFHRKKKKWRWGKLSFFLVLYFFSVIKVIVYHVILKYANWNSKTRFLFFFYVGWSIRAKTSTSYLLQIDRMTEKSRNRYTKLRQMSFLLFIDIASLEMRK